MNTDQPDNRDPEHRIELQPLDQPKQPPRHLEVDGIFHTTNQGDYGLPVPSKPLHSCPQCDYNLTGLLSRRCPECGTPFTLRDARRHGRLQTPEGRRYERVFLYESVRFYGGIGLWIAGIVTPIIVARFRAVPSNAPMWGFGFFIMLAACMYKVYSQKTWADTMLLAGLASATFATIVLLA